MRKVAVLLALGLFACDNKLSKERCEKFYTHISKVHAHEHASSHTIVDESAAMAKASRECPKDKYDCVMGSATDAEIEKCLTEPAP